jgi:hypothetical protein
MKVFEMGIPNYAYVWIWFSDDLEIRCSYFDLPENYKYSNVKRYWKRMNEDGIEIFNVEIC